MRLRLVRSISSDSIRNYQNKPAPAPAQAPAPAPVTSTGPLPQPTWEVPSARGRERVERQRYVLST